MTDGARNMVSAYRDWFDDDPREIGDDGDENLEILDTLVSEQDDDDILEAEERTAQTSTIAAATRDNFWRFH